MRPISAIFSMQPGIPIKSTPALPHDLIIASPKELDDASPMAERISHESELAPLVRGDGLL